ncbi:MAG: co-chaperone GroES [Chlamydiia bacterium]|nr:co-chaperone GroES [Chlamydiia bacterium]
MVKIRPLGKRILVKRTKSKTTKGGIFLPESAQEKPKEGEVIAVGPGQTNDEGVLEKPSVNVGDRVLFGAYAGTEVKDAEGEEGYLILSEEDVLGVFVNN